MAKMHELYAEMESIERSIDWIEKNATEGQRQKLADMVRTTVDFGLTPEEAQAFWMRKYDKAVYNAPYNRSLRESRRQADPQG